MTFRVFLDTGVNDMEAEVVNITHLRIPAHGYPVSYGTYTKNTGAFIPAQNSDLKDLEAVEKFFADLLSNPESTLIQAIGFALRRSSRKM